MGFKRSATLNQGVALRSGFHPMTWKKKYDWRITWPGEGSEDWVGYDGTVCIGRVMRDRTTHTHKDEFLWSGGAAQYDGFKKRLMPHQGWEPEHWQAAKAVEDWYDKMREMNGLEPRHGAVDRDTP